MTKISENIKRASYSRFANKALKMDFKAEKVTFTDSLSFRPTTEGYVRVYMELDELAEIKAEHIIYRLSTLGGSHKVYIKY